MSRLEELKARRREQATKETLGNESEAHEGLPPNVDNSHEFWRLVAIHIGGGTPRADAIRKIVLQYPELHQDMLKKHTAKYARVRNRH